MLHDAVTPCIVNIFLVFISMHITSFFCQLLIPVAYVSNAIAHLFTAWILFHPINFRRHTNLCLRRCSSLACSFVIPLRSRMFFTCLFFQSFLRDSITLYNANVIMVFLFNLFPSLFSNSVPVRDGILSVFRLIIAHFLSPH